MHRSLSIYTLLEGPMGTLFFSPEGVPSLDVPRRIIVSEQGRYKARIIPFHEVNIYQHNNDVVNFS